MSKRIYKLNIDDISEALTNYMKMKFPELKEAEDVNMKLLYNQRTKEFTLELEV